MEASYGLGLLIGPGIGGVIFDAFGFKGMFIIFAVVGIFMIPWIYYSLAAI